MLWCHQKPPASGRGMGHGHLQFRVILATRVFIGLRKIMIEDIFTLAVAFAVEWGHADGFTFLFGL